MIDSLATAIQIVAKHTADTDNLNVVAAVRMARTELNEAEVASWQLEDPDTEQAYLAVLRATDAEVFETLQEL